MSAGGKGVGDLADRIAAAALECRGVVREAHEATRDARVATKELREARADLLAAVDGAVSSAIRRVLGEMESSQIGPKLKAALENWNSITADTLEATVGVQTLRDRARLLVVEIEQAHADARRRLG